MHTNMKRGFSILMIVLLVTGGISAVDKVLAHTDSYFQYAPFLTDETEYDVLFFGSSHVEYAVSPMQLYREYGLTSYNMASSGASIGASCWLMKIALQYHKPKIAVLDVFLVHKENTYIKTGFLHTMLDAFPLTPTKVEAILNLYRSWDMRMEFIFPFSLYHNRWSDTSRPIAFKNLLCQPARTRNKGGKYKTGITKALSYDLLPTSEVNRGRTAGKKYIRWFIDLCRKEGILPVLMLVPYPSDPERQKWQNSVYQIAEEEGVPYLDLLQEEIVDPETDFFDADSHLNLHGSSKVTRRIGELMKTLEDLPDHRLIKEDSEKWDAWYSSYDMELTEALQTKKGLETILVFLSWPSFYAEIEIPSGFSFPAGTLRLLEQADSRLQITWLPPDSRSIHVLVKKTGTHELILERTIEAFR